jgi:phosphoenolpyruvate---glycerone phosphotransferase subunit DhaL
MLMFTRTDLSDLFRSLAERMAAEQDRLAELDGEIGDADHGVAMAQGFAAASHALIDAEGAGQTLGDGLALAATTLLNAVGATTGPLYASALLRAAQALGPCQAVPFERLADLIPAMAGGIVDRGRGRPGDKTMVDAWLPAAHAVEAGRRRGQDTPAVLRAAALAAAEGAEATRAMMAAQGRAARLGPRSIGHLDPGAASAAALLDSLARWAETTAGRRG